MLHPCQISVPYVNGEGSYCHSLNDSFSRVAWVHRNVHALQNILQSDKTYHELKMECSKNGVKSLKLSWLEPGLCLVFVFVNFGHKGPAKFNKQSHSHLSPCNGLNRTIWGGTGQEQDGGYVYPANSKPSAFFSIAFTVFLKDMWVFLTFLLAVAQLIL